MNLFIDEGTGYLNIDAEADSSPFHMDIPHDLLELTRTINFEQLQGQILSRITSGQARSVRQAARFFDFGKDVLTLALVFLCCLFLETEGMIVLEQAEGDVRMSADKL